MDTSDAERSGRPTENTTSEIIDKIDIAMNNITAKVRKIANAMRISTQLPHKILLNICIRSVRWLPRLMRFDRK